MKRSLFLKSSILVTTGISLIFILEKFNYDINGDSKKFLFERIPRYKKRKKKPTLNSIENKIKFTATSNLDKQKKYEELKGILEKYLFSKKVSGYLILRASNKVKTSQLRYIDLLAGLILQNEGREAILKFVKYLESNDDYKIFLADRFIKWRQEKSQWIKKWNSNWNDKKYYNSKSKIWNHISM